MEVAHFRFFHTDRASKTQNRRNANLVPKNDVYAYFDHRIVHRDAIWCLLKSGLG